MKKLFEKGILKDSHKNKKMKNFLQKFFKELSNSGEKGDFDTDGSSLLKETAFNWKKPWELSIDSIRNYFGEKNSNLFLFLGILYKIFIIYKYFRLSNSNINLY